MTIGISVLSVCMVGMPSRDGWTLLLASTVKVALGCVFFVLLLRWWDFAKCRLHSSLVNSLVCRMAAIESITPGLENRSRIATDCYDDSD